MSVVKDLYSVVIYRGEVYEDEMDFLFEENVTIKDVKIMMEKLYPYHPSIDTIKLYQNEMELYDEYTLSQLCYDETNQIMLIFKDGKKYVDLCPCTSEITDGNMIFSKAKSPNDELNVDQRRFRVIFNDNDGEVDRLVQQMGKHVEVINISLSDIIQCFVFLYILYKTKIGKGITNFSKTYLGFKFPLWIIWIVFSAIRLFGPHYYAKFMDKHNLNKDMVDFAPNGIIGDIWLCFYYFFATLIPTNWGPRVFRD